MTETLAQPEEPRTREDVLAAQMRAMLPGLVRLLARRSREFAEIAERVARINRELAGREGVRA
jgi:hypothetical protein